MEVFTIMDCHSQALWASDKINFLTYILGPSVRVTRMYISIKFYNYNLIGGSGGRMQLPVEHIFEEPGGLIFAF